MQEPNSAPRYGAGAAAAARDNGRGGLPFDPVDRSHLLRRSTEFPFPMPDRNGLVRIRRERRVCESFSGIRGLARRNRG